MRVATEVGREGGKGQSKRPRRTGQARIWPIVISLLVSSVVIYFVFGPIDANTPMAAKLPTMLAIAATTISASAALLFVILRWTLLARKPMKALARGDAKGAESAFQRASAYAQSLSKRDFRRGAMLSELAKYLASQGRHEEALAHHKEAVELLEHHWLKQPQWFFPALNNYAVYLMYGRRFGEAQQALEKLIDLLPGTKKPRWGPKVRLLIETLDIALRVNIAHLLTELGQFQEVDAQLRAAEEAVPMAPDAQQPLLRDMILAKRCLAKCAAGEFAEAVIDLNLANDPDQTGFLRARAAISQSRGDFEHAERFLRRELECKDVVGTRHRPEFFWSHVLIADAIFGQSKHDEAFASLQEARSIVADFTLPPDAAWRKSLEAWLQRARELGKADEVASLEAELLKMPATANQAITILEKFRIHPQAAK
jgi:tetratricopeptide (TPR) repeat protein